MVMADRSLTDTDPLARVHAQGNLMTSSSSSTREAVVAPAWPVLVAVAALVVAALAALLNIAPGDGVSVPMLLLGYLAGAIITLVMSAIYRSLRNSRRNHPRFRVQLWLDRLVGFLALAGLLVGLANAFLLATELAK